ncbi:MAG: F0F1 ATP synthase subunit B [Elusimicrobia bacterium]|nr:F0F1 ATP synthase subunit B [Elusimicrobiota bacterium]
MDKLLSPDFGLTFWTILTFVILVAILKPLLWEPVIQALKRREERLQMEREAAEKARADAMKIKQDLEAELARLTQRTQAMLDKAQVDGLDLKEEILRQAQEDSKRLIARGQKQLEEDRKQLIHELQREIGGLSVMVAEKILQGSVDPAASDRIVKDFLSALDGPEKREKQTHNAHEG